MNPNSSRSTAQLVALTALGLFTVSILFSLGGMTLMQFWPSSAARAGSLLPWLMKVPTWVYMLALPVITFTLYLRPLGLRASVFFLVWGSFIGMMAELIGTGTGFPFGDYEYTAFLNPKIMGHVPWFIPLSWYAVGVLSLDLATRLDASRAQRIAIAALYMVLWDVALDPAMGEGFPVWRWNVDGFFYGMPALNWVGWFATSLIIMWGYEFLGGGPPRTAHSLPKWVWLLNGAFPIGICLLKGLDAAFIAGTFAIAVPLLALWRRNGSARTP